MEAIIEKIPRELLLGELTPERFIRKTNNNDNEIYIITYHNSPNTMKEIARLRELTFRQAGGGTGLSMDLDEFDTAPHPYQQLLVWDPVAQEIIGAYRYILCRDAEYKDGKVLLATTELFDFSPEFYKTYLPYTIELGRSFIQPQYQPSEQFRNGLFSLDNLWDGLGAIVVDNPDMKYYYGKVTMYTDFNLTARDYILSFLKFYFPDTQELVKPIIAVELKTDVSAFLKELEGKSYKEGHAILNKHVRALGENIPPMVNAYSNLSSTMLSFGTAVNPTFGGVEETGILVTIADIYKSKSDRHIETYIQELKDRKNIN